MSYASCQQLPLFEPLERDDDYEEVDVDELLPSEPWEAAAESAVELVKLDGPPPPRRTPPALPAVILPPSLAGAEHDEDVRRVQRALLWMQRTRAWKRALDYNGRPFECLIDYVASLGVDIGVIEALAPWRSAS